MSGPENRDGPRGWRILIDRGCGVLRLTLFDPRLSPEQASELQSDLTYASLELKREGGTLVEYGDEV